MHAPCLEESHCSCVRSVVRCTGLTDFPTIPPEMRARLSKVDLRGSQISSVDVTMLRGMKEGSVVDLRDQRVETTFCGIEEDKITILFDQDCDSTKPDASERTPSRSPGAESTTSRRRSHHPATPERTTMHESTTPRTPTERSTPRMTTSKNSYSTRNNYTWIYTPRRRVPGRMDGANVTTTVKSQDSTTQEDVSMGPENHREYVLIIIVSVTVTGGIVVIAVIVCYCCCCYVETHCKCCLTHKSRHRRVSGDSYELFSHQVPENLPNLRFRAKEL